MINSKQLRIMSHPNQLSLQQFSYKVTILVKSVGNKFFLKVPPKHIMRSLQDIVCQYVLIVAEKYISNCFAYLTLTQ